MYSRGTKEEVVGLTLVSVPAEDIGASILLSVGKETRYKSQYVFGIPECLGRVSLEHKPKAGLKTTALFSLANCTEGAGGLGSLILELQRLGVGKTCLYGCKGIGKLVQGLQEVFQWKYPDVACFEVNGSQSGGVIHSDEQIQVMVLGQGIRGSILDTWMQPHNIATQPRSSSASEESQTSAEQSQTHDECSADEIAVCQEQKNYQVCSGSSCHNPEPGRCLQNCSNNSLEQVRIQEQNTLPWTESIQQDNTKLVLNQERSNNIKEFNAHLIKHNQQQKKLQNLQNKLAVQLGKEKSTSESDTSVSSDKIADNNLNNSTNFIKNINSKINLGQNSFYGYVCRLQFCGKIVLFVNFSSLSDLKEFQQGQIFSKLQKCENVIAGVIHLSSAKVCQDSEYVKISREFPGNQFILNNQEICETRSALTSSLRSMIRFNCLLPSQFQIPYHQMSGGYQKGFKNGAELIFDDKIQQCGLMVQIKINGSDGKIVVDREQSVLDVDAGEVRKELLDRKPSLLNIKESVQEAIQSCEDGSKAAMNLTGIQLAKNSNGGKIESQQEQTFKDNKQNALGNLVKRLTEKSNNITDTFQVAEKIQTNGVDDDGDDSSCKAASNNLKRKLITGNSNASEEDVREQINNKRQKFIQCFSEKDKLQQNFCASTDTEILFLGTGCSTPSKYRGPSAIFLRFSDNSGVLLDAGEGTWTCLTRHFGGIVGAQNLLNCMLCVWISHKHWDHVAGLPKLLEKRGRQKPLVVIAPPPVVNWIKIAYPHLYQIHRFVLNLNFKIDEHLDSSEEIFLKGIQSVPVIHCHDSYAAILSLQNGQKIVYSGDTRPCERLIRYGQNCDLLIHEATFEDQLLDHAINKGHSTILEAVRVSKKMQATACILSHFSQRYCNMPINVVEQEGGCFGVAFDGMRVRMMDLKNLPMYAKMTNFVCEIDDETCNAKDNEQFGVFNN